MPINPFIYTRNLSIDDSYSQLNPIILKPIYGSSVSFTSKAFLLKTIDNSIKIQPNSENNLIANFNLKFLLNDTLTGRLLKTIEVAGGDRYLKFNDPSNLYSSFTGLCQTYKVSKDGKNLNTVEIILVNNHAAPVFNWSKSYYLKNINNENNLFNSSRSYNKYDIVYHDDANYFLGNYSDNFWFAKNDVPANTEFNLTNFTKNFFHETKYPFEINNSLDVQPMEYKNSFTQYVRNKTNINALKNFPIRLENISDSQCRAILFFLEKKLGYKKFIYEFPLFFNKNKIFVCLNWKHTFTYFNCHEITMELNEDATGEEVIYKNGYYFINSN